MSKFLYVTDHALLRVLERIRGFSFAKEKAEIQRICAGVQNGTVRAHGHRFEIENGSVVTITPGESPNRTKRLRVATIKDST